jgi:hypothetical protein
LQLINVHFGVDTIAEEPESKQLTAATSPPRPSAFRKRLASAGKILRRGTVAGEGAPWWQLQTPTCSPPPILLFDSQLEAGTSISTFLTRRRPCHEARAMVL